MMKKIIYIAFASSILFSQSIIHSPDYTLNSEKNYNIEASLIGFIGNYSSLNATLFYRSYGQSTYFNDKMIFINGKFRYSISSSFIKDAIEYYIIIETNEGAVFAYPENSPVENPVLVKSERYNSSSVNSSANLIPKYEILSPEPDSYIQADELFISISYFEMDDIDLEQTKVFIDNTDYTKLANIKSSHIILVPDENLYTGEHKVQVIFTNKVGLKYSPITWKFSLLSKDIPSRESFIISQRGNLEGNYNNTATDDMNLQVGQLKGDYNIDFDWLKYKGNFLLSSLEDENEQTRNRFSSSFKTKYFNIMLGDSYPSFSDYTINGSRMRGVNINFKNKVFDINFLSGSLVRDTQGLPSFGAMLLLENKSPVFQASGFLDTDNIGVIDVSRDNYSFNQSLVGLNLAYMKSEKFKFKFEILKVKDKVQSVDQIIDNSIISLPESMVRHLYSDIFVDYNLNGSYDLNEYIGNLNQSDHDVVGSILWNDADDLSNINKDHFVSFSIDTVNMGSFSEEPFDDINSDGTWQEGEWFNDIDGDGEWSTDITYNTYQMKWNIKIYYEDLKLVIDDFINNEEIFHTDEDGTIDMSDCTYNDCFGDYDVKILDGQWEGVKPQDNIVLGTDFTHLFDNGSFKLNYGFSFSMLNQNIWSPTLTFENLDQLGAETAEDSTDGQFNGADIPEVVNNLDNFENIFQTGTSQIPIIPIDITDGIEFKDFLTLPSLAIYFDVSQKYFGHRINWGFKQIGPEFNSLGNPFLQTDIREQYFSDRAYYLDNKLNIRFKWKRTEDGISLVEDNGQTDKYDFNFGFYPGANLPTYNLSVGIYNRTNGIDPLYDPVLVVTDDVLENFQVDTLDCDVAAALDYICSEEELNDGYMIEDYEILSTQLYQPERTRTGQFSLSINSTVDYIYKHRINLNIFYSNKKDLVDIDKYLVLNNNYYSPRSMTQSYYLGLFTTFTDRLQTSLSINYNYYDYGYATEYNEDYFQSQNIIGLNFSTIYDTYSLFGKIDPGFNLSIGRGSTDFTQFSLKAGSSFEIAESLFFNINMNYKLKFIDKGTLYNNYSLLMDLKYKF